MNITILLYLLPVMLRIYACSQVKEKAILRSLAFILAKRIIMPELFIIHRGHAIYAARIGDYLNRIKVFREPDKLMCWPYGFP
jgi:hypothetical protein